MNPGDVREAARLIVQFADAHDAAENESQRALAMSALADLIADDDLVVEICRALTMERKAMPTDEMGRRRREHPSPMEIEELIKRGRTCLAKRWSDDVDAVWEAKDILEDALNALSHPRGRDEAIEEAAKVAESRFFQSDGFKQWWAGEQIAKAIRSLLVSADKEKDGTAAQVPPPIASTAEVRAASAFDGLVAVVQYRRKPERGHDIWHTMAAFDVDTVAEKYAKDCASDTGPWEYRAVPLSPKESPDG